MESGIGCHRGVWLGDGARKELEEDADLRAPRDRDEREEGRAASEPDRSARGWPVGPCCGRKQKGERRGRGELGRGRLE